MTVQRSISQVNRFDICSVLLLNWVCERCKSWPCDWSNLIAWRRPTTQLNYQYIALLGAVSNDCIMNILWLLHDSARPGSCRQCHVRGLKRRGVSIWQESAQNWSLANKELTLSELEKFHSTWKVCSAVLAMSIARDHCSSLSDCNAPNSQVNRFDICSVLFLNLIFERCKQWLHHQDHVDCITLDITQLCYCVIYFW